MSEVAQSWFVFPSPLGAEEEEQKDRAAAAAAKQSAGWLIHTDTTQKERERDEERSWPLRHQSSYQLINYNEKWL